MRSDSEKPLSMLRMLMRRSVSALFFATCTFHLTGCDVSSMQFTEDDRVNIVGPQDRSNVTLPMKLRWEVHNFTITGRDGRSSSDAGYFAVFIDRPPIPPGRTLEWYALQDTSCGASACGRVENLANIYTTEETTLELSRLPADDKRGALERHEAVIVLLDGQGQRIGESAFYARFNFERKA